LEDLTLKTNAKLWLTSVSVLCFILIPIIATTGAVNPPESIDYGEIVRLDHTVFSDESLGEILEIQYQIIINVSTNTNWHSGLIGMAVNEERSFLMDTPVKDCVHWVYIREIYEWMPEPPKPPEPFLDMAINGILTFASENLLGMIISAIVVIYLASKILLQ